jgi:hypothetical protein
MPISGVEGLINLGTIVAQSLVGNPGTAAGTASAIAINSNNLSLTTSGTLQIATGPIVQANTTMPAIFTGNTTNPVGPTGNVFHVIGGDGIAGNVAFSGYAATASLVGTRADGTAASPTAIQSQERAFNLAMIGYGATGYSSGNRASIGMFAAENWSDTAQGSFIRFSTTPIGSTALSNSMQMQASGALTIGTSTEVATGGNLQVRGKALLDVITLGTVAANPQIIQGTGAPPAGTVAATTLYLRNNGSLGAGLYFANAGGTYTAVALV